MGTAESTNSNDMTQQPPQSAGTTIFNIFYKQPVQPQSQPQPQQARGARLQSAQTRSPGSDVNKRTETHVNNVESQIAANQRQIDALKQQIIKSGRQDPVKLAKIRALQQDSANKQQTLAGVQRHAMRMNNAVTLGEGSRLMQDMSAVVDQELSGMSRQQMEKLMLKADKQDEGLDLLFEYVGDQLALNSDEELQANDALFQEIMAEQQQQQPQTAQPRTTNVNAARPANTNTRPLTNNTNTNSRIDQILKY